MYHGTCVATGPRLTLLLLSGQPARVCRESSAASESGSDSDELWEDGTDVENSRHSNPGAPGPSGRGCAPPTTQKPAPKPRKKRAPKAKAPKKVAQVLHERNPHDGAPESGPKAKVNEAILLRIRKALALGLHSGGNELEKQHAMQRATRLMQQYGLSQAGAHQCYLMCGFFFEGCSAPRG